MPNTISNSDDTIDSRDVIARIEELTDKRDNWPVDGIEEPTQEQRAAAWIAECEGEHDELTDLVALQEQAEGYTPDWKYGETLVRDSYFTEYVEEMLKECGDLPQDIPHYIVIDWDATANNVRMDYTSVEFGDVTYWTR